MLRTQQTRPLASLHSPWLPLPLQQPGHPSPGAVLTPGSQLQGREFSLVKADFLAKVFGSLLLNLPLAVPAHSFELSFDLWQSELLLCFSVSNYVISLRVGAIWVMRRMYILLFLGREFHKGLSDPFSPMLSSVLKYLC